MQVRLLHGPGRRPTSEQAFVTFAGPTGVAFSYVTEATAIADEANHRPRQFARTPRSFCAWGSESSLPETKIAPEVRDERRRHMIKLQDVSYVRLGTRDLEGAVSFATDFLGLEIAERTRERRVPQVRSARAHAVLFRR